MDIISNCLRYTNLHGTCYYRVETKLIAGIELWARPFLISVDILTYHFLLLQKKKNSIHLTYPFTSKPIRGSIHPPHHRPSIHQASM